MRKSKIPLWAPSISVWTNILPSRDFIMYVVPDLFPLALRILYDPSKLISFVSYRTLPTVLVISPQFLSQKLHIRHSVTTI
jgi:hypothetical protein